MCVLVKGRRFATLPSDGGSCWCLPLPPKHKVGDRADTVDEHNHRPQPLAAVDFLRWASSDVNQRRRQKRKLEHTQNYDAAFLAVGEILPLFRLHDWLLSGWIVRLCAIWSKRRHHVCCGI